MGFVLRYPPQSDDPKDLYKYLVELWKSQQAGTTDWDNIQDGTVPIFLHGDKVDNPSSGVHGVVGNVVGTTDTQTLTNKTIPNTIVITGIDYTTTIQLDVVKCTAAVTITLHSAATLSGDTIAIDNASAGNVTVTPDGADTIEDETSQTVPVGSCMALYSDGTNWRIT